MAACHLVAHLDLALLRDVDAHELVDAGRKFVLVFAGEDLDVDDDTALAVRHAEGGVAHFARLLAEDGAKETLFGGEFRFALGGDFADEDIAAVDFGADADDAVLVEVFQRVVAHVGDVARDLFLAELGVARFRLVLLDVDGGEHVVLHELFGDEDGVLVVIALPLHEADEDVLAEGKLAVVGGGTVCDDLALLDAVARVDDGTLVEAGALVGALELL